MELTQVQWDGLIKGLTEMYKRQATLEENVKVLLEKTDTTGHYMEQEIDEIKSKLEDIQGALSGIGDSVNKISK